MKRTRSVDLRQQALAALAGGASRGEVCQLFGIHRNTLWSWQQRAAQGSLENRYRGGNPRKIQPEQDPTGAGGGALAPVAGGSRCDSGGARGALAAGDGAEDQPLGDGSGHPAAPVDAQKKSLKAQEQDPETRRVWIEKAKKWDASRLVFLDECGVNTTLHRRCARAPRGERAQGVVPRNWKHNTTVVGALSLQGVQAALTLPGALDRDAFEVFIERILCPTLVPGQIVILDNLSSHKSPRAKQCIEEAGCSWVHLPTYSPDLNPIEHLWSQFKSYLRKQAARTQEQLDALIWPALCQATHQHIRNWFAHAGYA